MKQFLSMVVVAAVLGLAGSASAYFITGDWSWDAAYQEMTDNMDGTFTATLGGFDAGSRHEFKITDGTWDWSFPGPNSWFYADGSGDITVTFNTNEVLDGWDPTQYRLGLSVDPGAWTIAGSFGPDGDPLFWNNANPDMAMDSLGEGMYMLSKTLAAGYYEWKPVVTGTWDSISWDNRSVGTANVSMTLDDEAVVNFYVDSLGGAMRFEVVPEPATMALLGLGALLAIRRKK